MAATRHPINGRKMGRSEKIVYFLFIGFVFLIVVYVVCEKWIL
ncbi:protein of unknown function [Cupriavidus taiwanensis]|nr:hypothetical protein CBM2606_A90527 [Cupriavidus taiwanensis]SPA41998.1 protein of unknown function [Cupriavidus taiwanensis]